MMAGMEPQHISHKKVRIVKAVCANSGAGAEVRVSITTNESARVSWIDLRIAVAGDPPCQVILTPEGAADMASAIDEVRSAFLVD
jgi:hypothetical protein